MHTHSCYSDGTCTPAEMIRLAEEAGLAAIALCDHNTVRGLPDFLEAAKGSNVEAVPGIEFSTEYRGKELHVLGLFVEPEHYPEINELLEEALRRKEQSNIALVERLKEQGFDLDYWDIKAGTPGGSVNRAVIGAYLVHHGFCKTMEEAFDNWLSLERGLYVPPRRPDAYEVIRFIKSIGAVAVLAHPFLNLDEDGLRTFLTEAEGLDGMEVYYPRFSEIQTALACQIAEEFSLVKSGGSDFHGTNKPDIRMGTGTGSLRVGLECLEELRKRKKADMPCTGKINLL